MSKNRAEISAADFVEKVNAINVPLNEDPFEHAYTVTVSDLLEDLARITENKDDDVEFIDLVNHWIQTFADRAYRELADSINKSYSHVIGRIQDQGKARAFKDVADMLIKYRDFGFMDLSMTFLPSRA